MNLRSHLRLATVLSVLGVSLLSSLQLFKLTRKPPPQDQDALYLARFDGIKKVLPRHGVVCYVTDSGDSFAGKKHYFLAQYALAPLIVRTASDCDPLIGDFPASTVASIDNRQFAVLEDFGNGLMLLRRNPGR
jgi:hypothetical protein